MWGLLTPNGTPKPESGEAKELFMAVDLLNRQFGRGKVFSAAEGIKKPWKMKRSMLPKRATTSWRELIVAR